MLEQNTGQSVFSSRFQNSGIGGPGESLSTEGRRHERQSTGEEASWWLEGEAYMGAGKEGVI